MWLRKSLLLAMIVACETIPLCVRAEQTGIQDSSGPPTTIGAASAVQGEAPGIGTLLMCVAILGGPYYAVAQLPPLAFAAPHLSLAAGEVVEREDRARLIRSIFGRVSIARLTSNLPTSHPRRILTLDQIESARASDEDPEAGTGE
jgi:hypothetical protein